MSQLNQILDQITVISSVDHPGKLTIRSAFHTIVDT